MKNVGSMDMVLRMLLGMALISLLFIVDGNMKFIGVLGIPVMLTGLMRFCLMYRMLGINTCKR
ncbi:YgaP family membrane protein [Cohnella cholangitidis]|uniref:DUF2892 domain-containing protein n=1 Tax=Cohnella cholangitidis TaxID=2598458 RepID=A0A7G5C5U7_9BACL|nr:DUF2892 domain-containing protein [Cohnella cholangitidis]QMV44581.1 DUF2892 domain-containing protein [Cohnella cholangitidis]